MLNLPAVRVNVISEEVFFCGKNQYADIMQGVKSLFGKLT